MEKMYDISTSKYKQLSKIRNINVENLKATKEKKSEKFEIPEIKNKRMYELFLSDGLQEIKAIEYKAIDRSSSVGTIIICDSTQLLHLACNSFVFIIFFTMSPIFLVLRRLTTIFFSPPIWEIFFTFRKIKTEIEINRIILKIVNLVSAFYKISK